ncbi:MAG: acylglycerol kinase family protein [Patescibacteria group bacterium]
MYLYIYDEFVQDKKYQREMALIENRLTDLGIAGKVVRMALFRQAGEQVRDEARRGASTVVVVGNDQTVCKILDAAADVDLPLGIIPVGPDNRLAKMFGIPEGVSACDVLSARMIERIDTGLLNGKRFMAGVRVEHPEAVLTCEGQYRVSPDAGGCIEICNLVPIDSETYDDIADPRDGMLEARIDVQKRHGVFSKKVHATRLPIRFASIDAPVNINASCDGQLMQGKHFDISIEPLKLKVITGRERLF